MAIRPRCAFAGLPIVWLIPTLAAWCSAAETAAPALERYASETGGFQALMPPNPEYNKAQQPGGPDNVQHQYVSGAPDGVFLIAYQDHPHLNVDDPENLENLFGAARDAFQKAIGGEPTADSRIEKNGLQGREFRFDIPARQGACVSRMFFARKRWYHVLAMGTPEFLTREEATQFLDSFRLLDAAAPAAPATP